MMKTLTDHWIKCDVSLTQLSLRDTAIIDDTLRRLTAVIRMYGTGTTKLELFDLSCETLYMYNHFQFCLEYFGMFSWTHVFSRQAPNCLLSSVFGFHISVMELILLMHQILILMTLRLYYNYLQSAWPETCKTSFCFFCWP